MATDTTKQALVRARSAKTSVFHGDAHEGLKKLSDQSVDCIITEVPAQKGFKNGVRESRTLIAMEFNRVLKFGGSVWLSCSNIEDAHKWARALFAKKIGNLKSVIDCFYLDTKKGQQWIRFYKEALGDKRPSHGGSTGNVFLTEGGAEQVLVDEPTADLTRLTFYGSQSLKDSRVLSPGIQNPVSVEFLRYLIERERKLAHKHTLSVLDPFAGSGTVGVAALLEGCDVRLMDIDEACADACRKNLEYFSEVAHDVKSLEVAQLSSVIGVRGTRTRRLSIRLSRQWVSAMELAGGDISATCRAAFAAWLREHRPEPLAAPVSCGRGVLRNDGRQSSDLYEVALTVGQANILAKCHRNGYDLDLTMRIALGAWLLGDYSIVGGEPERAIPFGGKK